MKQHEICVSVWYKRVNNMLMLLGTRILSVEEGGYGCGMGQSEGKKDSIWGGGNVLELEMSA